MRRGKKGEGDPKKSPCTKLSCSIATNTREFQMSKKSKAQINRMMKRAEARGEIYQNQQAKVVPSDCEHPQLPSSSINNDKIGDDEDNNDAVVDTETTTISSEEKVAKRQKIITAKNLIEELHRIDQDQSLNAKERRSAKRKASAIALEKTGSIADDLVAWYKENEDSQSVIEAIKDERENQKADTVKDGNKTTTTKKKMKKKNPYILFVGQLSFEATADTLFDHIKTNLEDSFQVSKDTVKVRLLTDSKTKRSRGMAFVELSDPEVMYACLKLHHTMLQGRRINVERSAGGGRNSENRKAKISHYRTEQEAFMEKIVTKMMDEYKSQGAIKEGELDDGVFALCTRHSAPIVQAALEHYVESNGHDMDNPSAYLSFLLGKFATEGVYDHDEKPAKRQRGATVEPNKSRTEKSSVSREKPRMPKSSATKKSAPESELAKQGIDMSASFTEKPSYEKIFPSMAQRGRGR